MQDLLAMMLFLHRHIPSPSHRRSSRAMDRLVAAQQSCRPSSRRRVQPGRGRAPNSRPDEQSLEQAVWPRIPWTVLPVAKLTPSGKTISEICRPHTVHVFRMNRSRRLTRAARRPVRASRANPSVAGMMASVKSRPRRHGRGFEPIRHHCHCGTAHWGATGARRRHRSSVNRSPLPLCCFRSTSAPPPLGCGRSGGSTVDTTRHAPSALTGEKGGQVRETSRRESDCCRSWLGRVCYLAMSHEPSTMSSCCPLRERLRPGGTLRATPPSSAIRGSAPAPPPTAALNLVCF